MVRGWDKGEEQGHGEGQLIPLNKGYPQNLATSKNSVKTIGCCPQPDRPWSDDNSFLSRQTCKNLLDA